MLLMIMTRLAGAETYLVGPDHQEVLDLSEPDDVYVVPLNDPKLDLSAFVVATPDGDFPLNTILVEKDEIGAEGETMELSYSQKAGLTVTLVPGSLSNECKFGLDDFYCEKCIDMIFTKVCYWYPCGTPAACQR